MRCDVRLHTKSSTNMCSCQPADAIVPLNKVNKANSNKFKQLISNKGGRNDRRYVIFKNQRISV